MITSKTPLQNQDSQEARALFARLAAMNAMFEAARAGTQAQSFAHRAQSSDELLHAFLHDLKTINNQ